MFAQDLGARMSSILQSLTTSGFNPLSAFATAFFGGVFALAAIVFKQKFDFHSEKLRYSEVLKAEVSDVEIHFHRNILRLEAMISVLRDTENLWPERLHVEKLVWPQDTAIFNNEIVKFFSVHTANNIAKFRFRLRNANIDVGAILRIYDLGDRSALLSVLEYVRARSARLERLAPHALTSDEDIQIILDTIEAHYYKKFKDMIFLQRPIILEESRAK